MKPVLILFFFFTVSFSVFAQDTIVVQQNELIDLQNAIKEHSQKDTVLVQLLIDYANLCFYDLDFLNGLKAITKARTLSKELKFTKGEGLYLKSISIFRRRINEGNAFIKNPNVARINAGNEFVNNLDIYYEVEGNRILGQYTDLDVFGNISMPTGIRDSEIETIVSSLEEALSYYSEKENVEITAYLHEGLSLVYFKSDKEKSKGHEKVAQELYQELKLSYHQLLLLVNEIDDLLRQGLEAEAKPLEIEAINIYSQEADKLIKAHGAFLLSRTYGMHNRANLQLEYLFLAEELLSDIGEKDLLKSIYLSAASVYEWYFTNSEKALEYEYKELNLRKEIDYYESVAYTYLLISESLFGLKKIQDFPAEYKDYLKIGAIEGSLFFDAEFLWAKARMLQAQGKKEAQSVFQESIASYMKYNDRNGASWAALDLAESYKSVGDLKNAIKYAQTSFDWASELNLLNRQIPASELLSQLYEQMGQKDKAFTYLKQYRAFKDEDDKLNNEAHRSELEMQTILKKRQREIELLERDKQLKEQENKTQRVWIISIGGALASLILLSFILVKNNRQKQQTNKVLETTLANLKSTQAQLIQSEKMASLGELTAGIAHEIQNPLNFVNNFSEVNIELLEELNKELDQVKTQYIASQHVETQYIDLSHLDEVKDILNDLESNQQKIIHHGKRADSIVKGMLMHSRSSKGEKIPIDINALCDEFLRLSYHGLRARDRTFNADFEMDFDETIPKIEVVPQDIGRVMLNLINNAFCAASDEALRVRHNLSDGEAKSDSDFIAKVKVQTKNLGDKIEISVIDNGPGIPDAIKDKIFQPFFTTKPTGQGTGLGLSLAYDIVKAHGGTLEVESKEGEGTAFFLILPLKHNGL